MSTDSDSGPGSGGREQRVLIVEDEKIIREVVARALRQAGYRVIEAVDARNAIEAVGSEVRRLDLVVSDVSLPHGGSGFRLFEDLRRWNGELKAIFISGYAKEVLSGLPAGAAFLEKPFETSALLAAVREALGQTDTDSD